MLITTTPIIEGKRIVKYYGIVSGETIIGANVFRDLFASIRDIVGGRSGAYEEVLRKAKDTALQEMQAQAAQLGANAVIGVDLDYETVGGSGSVVPWPLWSAVWAAGVWVFCMRSLRCWHPLAWEAWCRPMRSVKRSAMRPA